MDVLAELTAPCGPDELYRWVEDLGTYPRWLEIVTRAEPLPDAATGAPAWAVDLRGRLGPLARSKRLRMQRTESVGDRLAVFERAEIDGRDHAAWTLRVELEPVRGDPETTNVTMHLAYDGSLWTGGVLARVLDDQIRRGRDGLAAAVADASERS